MCLPPVQQQQGEEGIGQAAGPTPTPYGQHGSQTYQAEQQHTQERTGAEISTRTTQGSQIGQARQRDLVLVEVLPEPRRRDRLVARNNGDDNHPVVILGNQGGGLRCQPPGGKTTAKPGSPQDQAREPRPECLPGRFPRCSHQGLAAFRRPRGVRGRLGGKERFHPVTPLSGSTHPRHFTRRFCGRTRHPGFQE